MPANYVSTGEKKLINREGRRERKRDEGRERGRGKERGMKGEKE